MNLGRLKYFIVTLLLFCFALPSIAGHIAGGEVFYTELSRTASTVRYKISIRLFRECNPPPSGTGQGVAEMPSVLQVGIFANGGPTVATDILVSRTDFTIASLTTLPNCLTNAPEVCYQVGTFEFERELTINALGYTVAYQTCCRTNGIANVTSGTGSTYAGYITPASFNSLPVVNSSPVFTLASNTNLVCQNRRVSFPFSATDADGDSLVYSFCDAYNGGAATNAANIAPAAPPYGSVNYVLGFSGAEPLGPAIKIDPQTGVISGTSPAAGSYVVTVCVAEFRQGRLLGVNRKDFTLKIGACDYAEANLNPNSRVYCETLTYNFVNGSTSPSIQGYLWDFGVPNRTDDTSTDPTPSFTYPDTGVYQVKLTVFGPNGCNNSDTLLLAVYPGFEAKFDVAGSCYINPYQFTDRTSSRYGTVNYWKWDFGDPGRTDDTSRLRNPSFTYPSSDIYRVQLIARNSKGCEDTAFTNLQVGNTPPLAVSFQDTLICKGDSVQLSVTSGNGVLRWTPNSRITSVTVPNPIVFPVDTTVYVVSLNLDGCIARDSVKVNVVNQAFVRPPPDTAICAGDSFRINALSNALTFQWTPDSSLNDGTLQQPVAFPVVNTVYNVLAKVSERCQARGQFTVRVVPYPVVFLSGDSVLCYGKQGRLLAVTNGSRFTWQPLTGILNPNTLNPTIQPVQTTRYIIRVTDTLGCPKPVYDTQLVRVVPPVIAYAGRDTVAVGGQPVQLHATGGQLYQWQPAWPLNRTDTCCPIATITTDIDSVLFRVKVSTPEGCFAYDDVQIKIYQLGDIFVPTAFTPNGDGRNDVLRAIPVGFLPNVEFSVYNRIGQLVFYTKEYQKGWDGTYKGIPQPSGTYVFFAKGTDYTGKPVIKKGTAVLIR